MKKNILIILICFTLILLSFSLVYALPNLQVYIPGSTAGNVGGDEDSWIYTGSGSIPFNVVISFGPKDVSVSNVTLLLSVKQDQVATGSITGLTHLGYYTDTSFLPKGADNNHYPLNKVDEYDYFIFNLNLDTIKPTEKSTLPDYNADTGMTTESGYGWEYKNLLLNISGYNYVHFDVYALFDNTTKEGGIWEINPGSHDSSTVVPEPATIFLMGSGLLGVGIVLRKKLLKPKNK